MFPEVQMISCGRPTHGVRTSHSHLHSPRLLLRKPTVSRQEHNIAGDIEDCVLSLRNGALGEHDTSSHLPEYGNSEDSVQ